MLERRRQKTKGKSVEAFFFFEKQVGGSLIIENPNGPFEHRDWRAKFIWNNVRFVGVRASLDFKFCTGWKINGILHLTYFF